MLKSRFSWVLAYWIFAAAVEIVAADSGALRLHPVPGRPPTFSAANLIPSRIYEMQKTDDLRGTNWTSAGFLWSDGLETPWRDEGESPQAFFRLKQTSRQVFESRVHLDNYLVYYGFWDETTVAKLLRYDLVVLNPNNGPADVSVQKGLVQKIRLGLDGMPGTPDDVLVLGYISMGEDQRTYNHAPPDPGDGSGPCYFDRKTGKIVYENNGYASYYLDEWNISGPLGGQPPEHDGIPDRNGEWGACYVNAGDKIWLDTLIGKGRVDKPISFDAITSALGCDGFFLDTTEVASPWEGFGWTASGMHELIRTVRELNPDKILLLNRGLFFFMPMYPVQYQWNPRHFIDLILHESFFLDSNYGDQPFHISPYFAENLFVVSPKLQAELGRPDSFHPILSLNYSKDPNLFPSANADIYMALIERSVKAQGRIEFLTVRSVDSINSATIDNPVSRDRSAPTWMNSTSGYLPGSFNNLPQYMSLGIEDTNGYPPRAGIQKAIPVKNGISVQWDVAADQSRPVRYNIYYCTNYFPDISKCNVLTNVMPSMPLDYTNRSYTHYDDNCPYEYTITNLRDNTAYYFAVRAEDSTLTIDEPEDGRIGPNGGIEETNSFFLAAAPRSGLSPIEIDGRFEDWANITAFQDSSMDAGGGEVDWLSCKFNDDPNYFFIYYKCASEIPIGGRHVIYFNTDCASHTGYLIQNGAEYMFLGGNLFHYTGRGADREWELIKAAEYTENDGECEVRIAKKDISATSVGGGVRIRFYGDNSNGTIDYMPDAGTRSFHYLFLVSPRDATPPEFDTNSLVAVDAQIDGAVFLSWSEANDENGPIRYQVNKDGISVAVIRETHFTVIGLSNNVSCSFAVNAIDSQGNWIASATRKVVPTMDAQPPLWTSQTGVQNVIAQDGLAKIYWNKAADETSPPVSYNIYVSTQPTIDFDNAQVIRKVALSLSDKAEYDWMHSLVGLTNNVPYYFAVRCQDRVGNEDYNRTQLSAISKASLKISAQTMDGAFGDWTNDIGAVFFGMDAAGDRFGNESSADIRAAWACHDSSNLFLRLQFSGDVTLFLYDYIAFIDTDISSKTGYRTSWDTVGAEYMTLNNKIYRYAGSGLDWSWVLLSENVLFQPGLAEKNNLEMAIPLAAMNLLASNRSIGIFFYVGDRVNSTEDDGFPDFNKGGFIYTIRN